MRIGIIMDPPHTLHVAKDSSIAMLKEAAKRGFEIYYFNHCNVSLRGDVAFGLGQRLTFQEQAETWYHLEPAEPMRLSDCQILFMRKDPPIDENYFYLTYVLEAAQAQGSRVVNPPQALRDFNEKLFATHFPTCIPPTLVSASSADLLAFYHEHKDIVCKPLNSMGGQGIFRIQPHDVNYNAILQTLTHNGTTMIMAQRFIPEISAGDKRILFVGGEPIPFMLNRVPQANDWRGNLAQGAKGVVQPITEVEAKICAQLSPVFKRHQLDFVGIDIIGNYLTEINITSPTGIREIEKMTNISVTAKLFDVLENKK